MAKRKPPPTIQELKAMAWKDYIKSTWWKNFSKSLLDKDDCSCAICKRIRWSFYKKTGLRKKKPDITFNCHHKSYEKMGEETPTDVLTLCSRCHDYGHLLYSMSTLKITSFIFKELYQIFCVETAWEYIPFKEKNNE